MGKPFENDGFIRKPYGIYPLVMSKKLWKMAIYSEFSRYKLQMVIFQSFVYVYQRVVVYIGIPIMKLREA